MIRICFVCLGNICRSPMAEFIMKDKVGKLGIEKDFKIDSKATSYEEQGNDIYPPAKSILREKGIPFTSHQATRLEKDDSKKYDYFICMDEYNISATKRIIGEDNNIIKLLKRDVSDPWYTRDFNKTYEDLNTGIDILIKKLIKRP